MKASGCGRENDHPEPVASRGADLHRLALGERRRDLRRWRGSAARDHARRREQPGRREAEPLRIGAGGGRTTGSAALDDVRIYNRALSAAETGMLADLTPVTEIAALPEDKRTPAQADKIRDYFLEHAPPASLAEARTRLTDAQAKRDSFYQSLPRSWSWRKCPPRARRTADPRDVDRPGEVVTPMLPAALVSGRVSAESAGTGAVAGGSVESADGARDGEPLLADVLQRRIVRTTEDFGSQGEAVASRAAGLAGDRVRADRLGCQSAPEDDRDERDLPAGLACGRICGRRIPTTVCSLAGRACGSRRIWCATRRSPWQACWSTGRRPSVKPYQPEGLWNEIGGGGAYVQDHGDNLYRRSVYVLAPDDPAASMANFDASARESHMVGR